MADANSAADASVDQNLSDAAHGEGMAVPEGGAKAMTLAHGGPNGAEAEPALFHVLSGPVWVSLAMAVFFAILIWKKVPGLVTRGLDNQIAAIRTRLDDAKQLRAEAEALRDEYTRKIAGAEAEMAQMIAHADEEAKALIVKAEADAKELTVRRAKMAEDKIAAAERAALDAIRAKTADAATKAAAAIIAEKHGAEADQALVDKTISNLSRLN